MHLTDAAVAKLNDAFRQKRWASLAELPAQRTLSCELMRGFGLLELGDARGVSVVRAALDSVPEGGDEAPFGLVTPWLLRRHFGATKVREWKLDELILRVSWRLLTTDFRMDWVSEYLGGFSRPLSEAHLPKTPWQLGGSAAVIEGDSEERVRSWVRLQLLAAEGLGPFGSANTVQEVGEWLERQEPLESVLSVLGSAYQAVAPSLAAAAMTALDALLLVEDVRGRLEPRLQARGAAVKRVCFRATPLRALEVAVCEMNEPGRFATLARHVTETAKKARQPGFTWTEGSLEEALAAVPDEHFAAAVEVMQRPR